MIRMLGALGAALIALAPHGFSQTCDNSELAGGRGGACVISVTQTRSGPVRAVRPVGSGTDTRPVVYRGVGGLNAAEIEKTAGVTVIRRAEVERADPRNAGQEEARPTCRYRVRRLSNRRDGERRFNICIDDLAIVNTSEGVEALYARLQTTARAACPRDGRRFTERAQRRCIQGVMERTIEASGIEQLALYHGRVRSRDFDERVAIVGPGLR